MRFGEITRCQSCGALLTAAAAEQHACAADQVVEHQVEIARRELDRLEDELGAYLETPSGRFEVWYAARTRPGRTGGADPAAPPGRTHRSGAS